jgi:exosome complex component RRP41
MQNSEILALAGLRVDGRRPDEVRSMRHQFGVSPEADGSVYFEQGLNKVMVNVHGPREPSKRPEDETKAQIEVRLATAPFSGSEWKKRRIGDRKTVEMQTCLEEVLSAVIDTDVYPKSQINVVVNIFESDGSTLCAIVNAICLALMDAGIAMSDMPVACSIGNVKGMLCQDCTQLEQNSGGAYIPLVMKAHSQEVVYMSLDNRMSAENLQSSLLTAQSGCKVVAKYLETAQKLHMVRND